MESCQANEGDSPAPRRAAAARERSVTEAAAPGWLAEVERHDPERYLTTLFAPPARRLAQQALLAFNLEVAKTAELVSEPLIGQIRLQWWYESLDGIYGGRPRHHEVVAALGRAIGDHDLPREPFERLLEARERDLESEPPADLPALLDYAEATAGGLLGQGLRVLAGPEEAPEAALKAALDVGTAWGLVGLLRAVPFHARQKRLYLPADALKAAAVDLGALFELQGSPALSGVVAEVASAAGQRLEAARALRGSLPRRLRPALLSGALAQAHLSRLSRAGHDPFDPRVGQPLPGAAWRLMLSAWRGRY